MDRAAGFGYRPALDGLRAFAVLAVIAYHLDYGWARGGFLGVDAFFVLSGYLITSLLLVEHRRSGRISPGAFWGRRARRLLPAVLVLLVAVAAYGALRAPTDQLEQLRRDSLATLVYVANWRFIIDGQSYFDLFAGALSPLRHMWSLAIEEQFYLLWPLLVFGCLAWARGRVRVLVAVCSVGLVVSVTLMAALYEPVDPSRAYFGTDARAHQLLVGALLALLLARWRPSPRAAAGLRWAGLAAGLGVLVALSRLPDTAAVYYRGGSFVFAVLVATLIAGAVQEGPSPLRAGLSWGALRWIGIVSYGVYLWHWPLIVWMTPLRTGLDGLALDAARVGATFVIATGSFYLLERPIRTAQVPLRRVVVAVPTAMATVGGLLVLSTVGATTNPLAATVQITAPPPPSTSVPTTAPGASDSAAATPDDPEVASAPVVAPETAPVESIAMVGDSVAGTISWGLGPAAEAAGIRFVDTTFAGCGVAAGFMLDENGTPFEWSQACFEQVPPAQAEMIASHDPDVVVWMSTWELADRREGGAHLRYGTPEHDAALLAAFEEAHARLTAGGARIVLLTVVPRAESNRAPAETDPTRTDHYNALLEEFASRHPDDVVLIDTNEIVCPGGVPCPREVDGVALRPDDGGHYTEETAPALARRLLPMILAALA